MNRGMKRDGDKKTLEKKERFTQQNKMNSSLQKATEYCMYKVPRIRFSPHVLQYIAHMLER